MNKGISCPKFMATFLVLRIEHSLREITSVMCPVSSPDKKLTRYIHAFSDVVLIWNSLSPTIDSSHSTQDITQTHRSSRSDTYAWLEALQQSQFIFLFYFFLVRMSTYNTPHVNEKATLRVRVSARRKQTLVLV